MSKFTLPRRTMLRGMAGGSAIAVGLPLLEAMLNSNATALASGDDLPLRFISYYWADGVSIDQWEPPVVGAGYDLVGQLAGLAPHRDYVSIVTGLRNNQGVVLTHHEGMSNFSGHPVQPTGGLNSNATGPTIDQVIADVPGVADRTPVRAIHVRNSKRESTDGDGGTTVTAMSHRQNDGGGLVPQVPEFNPVNVWQTLFGTFDPGVDDRDIRASIIDYISEDAERLKNRLGMADQQRVDAHIQGLAELQDKILSEAPACELPDVPTETNTDSGGEEPITSVQQAMADLIAYAFVCDITRVATILFKKFVSSTVFDEINTGTIHHNASHSGQSGNASYRAGVTYQMDKFAQLLDTLASYTEPDDTNLLDSTIIYATSDISNGPSHSVNRIPQIVAGAGRGYLVHPGIHYQSVAWSGGFSNPNSQGNVSDTLLTCLRAFDPDAGSVGSGSMQSSSVIDELIA